MSKFALLPDYWCSTARAVCNHFRYIRGHMRRTTLNVQTLVHTESQVSLNIQQEGSRPVGTHAQPESSHARISQIPMPPQIHDEAADDDDVIISSAREFEQARRKKNQRRNHRRTLNSEGPTRSSPNNLSKRIRGPSNLEIENACSAPQKKLEFTCPVCLGPIVQEMSTKCGHVFCKDCITQSTVTQGKCPVCRTKISMKDSIKIYLPMAC